MKSGHEDNHRTLLEHVIIPVANEKGAEQTARALEPHEPNYVTALHVVEKGEGVPDRTPVGQSHELAAESFAAIREVFPSTDEHTVYGRKIVEAIFEAADEVGASAIAYRSRGGGRLMQFLSGDLSLKLVTSAEHPVIVFPQNKPDL